MFMLASYLEVYEKTNTAERLKWLKMAANQGHVEAIFKLEQISHRYIWKWHGRAVSWYESRSTSG